MTMKKHALLVATILSVLMLSAAVIRTQQSSPRSREHTEWIAESLKEMETIKVGMTRADLLKVFTTEGGLSTRINRTYVFRECLYIKVDVEFEPVGTTARDPEGRVTLVEANEDLIKKISKPYLAWEILD
jgi:hypothetical protein